MANYLSATFAQKEHLIGDYQLLQTVGRGGFGTVKLARHLPTRTKVAVKVISQGTSIKGQEMLCHKRLNHPNIVQLFEVITTKNKTFLVMEHVSGGNLAEYLEAHGPMTEDEARHVFRQLVSAVQYCHQKAIVHRDLKPRNVLIDSEFTVKLADFGFSQEVTGQELCTYCGTFPYMAPEVLRREPYDGTKVDVWSLGVTLYRMVLGVLPFVGSSFLRMKKRILEGWFHVPHSVSMEGRGLLRQLMTFNPINRPRLEDVMNHPWLNKGQKKPLRPYTEPPWRVLDPQVMQIMTDMGFKRHSIKKSVKGRRYDSVMGTYLILRMKRSKMEDSSMMSCSSSESETRTSTSSSSLEVSITPPSSLYSSTSAPSSAIQVVFMGYFSPRGRRITSRGAAPEGPTNENCPQPEQPDRGIQASLSDSSHGWRGLARRAVRFLLRFTCCGPSTSKGLFKKTEVNPM